MKLTKNVIVLIILTVISIAMFYHRFPQELFQWILFGIIVIMLPLGFINEYYEERKIEK